jgi:hypothetical protein
MVASLLLTLGAGKLPATVRVDDWDTHRAGTLNSAAGWQFYPPSAQPPILRQPPSITVDGGRSVLQLVTDRETLKIGRAVKVDVRRTPLLLWEWKPLILPEGGDLRDPKRNDQAARVLLVFEGMKAILYVWDTTAPVGTEARPDVFDLFQRVMIAVRSGPQGLGQWHQEKRDVDRDYRRVFEAEPRPIKWIGFESHSDDVQSQSSVLFGPVRFEAR